MTEQDTQLLDEAFDRWWYVLGSGYRPTPNEYHEDYVHRVARLAWMACARQVIHLQLPPSAP